MYLQVRAIYKIDVNFIALIKSPDTYKDNGSLNTLEVAPGGETLLVPQQGLLLAVPVGLVLVFLEGVAGSDLALPQVRSWGPW